MIKKELDQLIKETPNIADMKTICISELDYLNLCVIKKRSKIKVYKGLDILFTDKIEAGTIYLLPAGIEAIRQQLTA